MPRDDATAAEWDSWDDRRMDQKAGVIREVAEARNNGGDEDTAPPENSPPEADKSEEN